MSGTTTIPVWAGNGPVYERYRAFAAEFHAEQANAGVTATDRGRGRSKVDRTQKPRWNKYEPVKANLRQKFVGKKK